MVFCEPDILMLLIIIPPWDTMWLLVSEVKLLKLSSLEMVSPARSGMEPL